jgi:hypothetical protein
MTVTAEAIVPVLGPGAKSRFVSSAWASGSGRRDAFWRESIVRAVETLALFLVATAVFMWVILAHPTPDEQSRLYDSMGSSTGIAWR